MKLISKAKKAAQCLTYLLTLLLPKKRMAVLRGFPDYEDNLLAIYTALSKRKIKNIVWVVDNKSTLPPVDIEKKTKVVKRGSAKDIYYSSVSKYLFITHGHFLQETPPNQVCINLWHGIPFKRIGKMLGEKGRRDTYLASTSEFTQKIFEQSFETSKENILITGQPRTDRMIGVDKKEILRRAFSDSSPPKFLLIWLPTFRSTNYLGNNLDGKDFKNVFNCSDFSVDQFNAILQKHDAYCIVKPHPMAVSQDCTNASNLIFINENWLFQRKISLYELIGVADCLVSDISSVIADFMLLDKPIVLLFEDIEQYKDSRGFSLNPITSYLPAEVTRNFREFIHEIETVLTGQDVYAERRDNLKKIFFKHSDANAANRLLDIVLNQ